MQRAEDSWLVDGALPLGGDFYSGIGVDDPDEGRTRGYHTVAGLVMTTLGISLAPEIARGKGL